MSPGPFAALTKVWKIGPLLVEHLIYETLLQLALPNSTSKRKETIGINFLLMLWKSVCIETQLNLSWDHLVLEQLMENFKKAE